MKLKTLIISLLILIGTSISQAQNIDDLSRDEIRELMPFVCAQISSPEVAQMGEELTGMSTTIKATIAAPDLVELKYTVPGYELGNSPQEQALTKLMIRSGSKNMPEAQKKLLTGFFKKGGYNLRIIYTDGGTHSCILNLTPTQLEDLYCGSIESIDIKPSEVRDAILKNFASGVEQVETPGIKNTALIEGKWLTLNMLFDEGALTYPVEPDVFKSFLLDNYRNERVVVFLSSLINNEKDFIGLDGIKITYGTENGKKRECYITWNEITDY